MTITRNDTYSGLIEKARLSHAEGRRTDLIGAEEIDLARLYCYAFRLHIIGSFHATKQALAGLAVEEAIARAHIERAVETLEDLANQGMEPVPTDYRALISMLYRYDRGVSRVVEALERASEKVGPTALETIRDQFTRVVGEIVGCNGVYLTRDTVATEQATFVVPNLGITIVPLVYGDHHSWNLAYLNEENLDVPMHRHMHGVEIHLGYRPLEGYMVLGDCKAAVDESYAMPIPPRTRHGWANISGVVHHVPFVFGSLEHAGWGVYFDVEPVPKELDDLRTVRRTDWQMGASIFLEREIDAMAQVNSHQRRIVIPAAAMDRNGSGGLELAVSRVTTSGCSLPLDSYRAVSVVRGRGQLSLGPTSRSIAPHDHFGVPRGMAATIKQLGDEPMVLLDALIRGAAEGFQSP